LTGGSKMSKSSGTGVNPMDYMEQFGVDAFRYFLAREMVVGQDCTFSDDAFKRRINSDLANDLGNVLNRIHRLVLTNFEGKLPKATQIDAPAQELITLANQVREQVFSGITQVKLSQVIEDIMSLVRGINRYLEIKAPWKLAKDSSAKDEIATVLFIAAEAVRLSLCFLWPVMPTKTVEGLAMLGCTCEGEKDLHWGKFQGGESFGEGNPLFPRIEVEKAPPPPTKAKEQNKPILATEVPSLLDLRCAKILSVEDHPDAESLYVLKVDAGEKEIRTICSGLKKSYTPEELKDRLILLFANLKPAPLRGILSMGMLLAGDGENGKAVLATPDANTKVGTRALFKGVKPSESRELKIKDFDKISLYVKGKTIFCDDKPLEFNGISVFCDVAEGASVH